MIVYSSDTDMTPFDVGAYASSTTYLSGEAVRKAAADAKRQILHTGAEMLGLAEKDVLCKDAHVQTPDGKQKVSWRHRLLRAVPEEPVPNHRHRLPRDGKSPPPFAAHYTEIEVDTWTGNIKVLRYVSTIDCRPIIRRCAKARRKAAPSTAFPMP